MGFTELFGEWEEPTQGTGGEFDVLPDGTKVIAELVGVAVHTYDGRISPETTWKIVGTQAAHAGGHFGKVWDKFKLKFPATEFGMRGQPDEAVKKWKASKAIWSRSIAAVVAPEVDVKAAVTVFADMIGNPPTEAATQIALATRVGHTVILTLGLDAAGREYTDKNGQPATTSKSKNTVKYYDPDTPANRAKYGLVVGEPVAVPAAF